MLEVAEKSVEELTRGEKNQVDEITNLAFAADVSEDLCWSSPERYILGKIDDRVVSVVGILYRQIHVGEKLVWIIGVGGVATHPDFQRRGYSSSLMRKAGDVIRGEKKVSFGLLVCGSHRVAFYGRFGWQLMNAKMYFECRGERRLYKETVMIFSSSKESWPDGEVDLLGGPW